MRRNADSVAHQNSPLVDSLGAARDPVAAKPRGLRRRGMLVTAFVLLLASAPSASASVRYVTQWGGYGSGDGQFILPAGVATDSAGYVYVVDQNNNRIQKFSSSGTFLAKW